MFNFKFYIKTFIFIGIMSIFTGCFGPPPMPSASALVEPKPIMDNSGKFMFAYTQDEVLAKWVDNAMQAKGASQIGGALGAAAGAKLLENVPFVGGMLGEAVGNKIGREIALKAAGGEEVVKNTSDISFNNPQDLCVYAYIKYSSNPHYQDAMSAMKEIYPGSLKDPFCMQALYRAPRK
jgi:hypothetical protein